MKFLIPVFFLIDEDVLLGIVKDAFCGFGLLQPIVGLNQQVDGTLGIIVEFQLPIVECLGISITLLSNLCESTC